MQCISIRGARTHNLKNISVDLPRNKLCVITGLSGSGKSSLAFDTLYAEGQRRYVESLSAYARQFLSIMEKPDVDSIEGLSPAISIEQKSSSRNPRSTVGTVTEIHDYLRLLFARVGEPRCPEHGSPLQAQTVSQMVDAALNLESESKIMILAPIVQGRRGEHLQLIKSLQASGYVRVRIDGLIHEIDDLPQIAIKKKHNIEVVVDRLVLRADSGLRLAESFENALRLSSGIAILAAMDGEFTDKVFSQKFACSYCGYSLTEFEPKLFSFNNPAGACITCDGLGFIYHHGMDDETISETCSACHGKRLSEAASNVFIDNKSLPELSDLSIKDCFAFFNALNLEGSRGAIAEKINREVVARLGFLLNVGLDYLSLGRSAETLSGGEAQRIRLASQIGSGLVGVMYVLDEPSIGLHQRDNARLLSTLLRLRDLGNTVIVVEHDEDAIRAADYILDIGPRAGIYGGEIVAQGSLQDILQNPESLTAKYLARVETIALPEARTPRDASKFLQLNEVYCNNLQGLSVGIPLGLFTCITGVSGSGKSSLINDTLYPLAAHLLNGSHLVMQSRVASYQGFEHCKAVIDINQKPIGRTPRSNAATYTGMFTPIRELFAATPEARARGYTPSRFSFNVKGGRCEACEGDGVVRVAMHFLPDMFVVCDVCHGKRYNRDTLSVRYKGKNVYEVLELSVDEALEFFAAVPTIARKCQTLLDVGLSYIKIGQAATTLSGGEAQRVKLSKELSKRDTGSTLYILDEPTVGLHFHDTRQLLQVLLNLRDLGNTILVIEHNLDVIKMADWIIDLGPEGGSGGGKIIATGTPEELMHIKGSYTGEFLRQHLERG
jgi:excinuclease ABC subunit A